MFPIFASIAEFERELTRERTMAGLAAARARGRAGGRRPTMTPDKLARAKQLRDERALTMSETAAAVGTQPSTLHAWLAHDEATRNMIVPNVPDGVDPTNGLRFGTPEHAAAVARAEAYTASQIGLPVAPGMPVLPSF